MAKRPYVSFAEVKEKVSIPDVLQTLRIADQFRVKDDTWIGCCPLLQHQHGPQPNENQFRIDCKKGLWLYRCFGDCSETELGGGDVINFVKGMTGLSDAHVRFWFVEHFGERLGSTKSKRNRDGPVETKEAREVVQEPQRAESKVSDNKVSTETAALKPLRFRLNLDAKVPYLRERGLSDKTIERFGLGLCSRGIFKGYCAIPVYRYPLEMDDENPVAYLGRWPGEDIDEQPGRLRYKWPDGFEKSRVVYGLHEALKSTSERDPLILVEGCFSVFHLVQQGVSGAVACFGASLSIEQADLLIATRRPITVMFDGNEAGRRGQHAAAEKLATGTFVRSIALSDEAEPESLESEELASLLS